MNIMDNIFNIRRFGAVGDGQSVDTKAINEVIELCSKSGGGIVVFPPGQYICGTIELRENIFLYLNSGATLIFDPEEEHFKEPKDSDLNPYCDFETSVFPFSLIYGNNVSNFKIIGGKLENRVYPRGGPKPIALKNCRDFTISDITIEKAPNYAISLLNCSNFHIENVKIIDGRADGIDLDNCSFGKVSGAYINTFDDGICIKTSTAGGKPEGSKFITISDCIVGSSCNAFKLGTESNGDFRNIVVMNCVIFHKEKDRIPISAIAIESVDGGNICNINISNIAIECANTVIFIRRGFRNRGHTAEVPGEVSNIIISNISVENTYNPIICAGIPQFPIKNLIFDNVTLISSDKKESKNYSTKILSEPNDENGFGISDKITEYPEANMFYPLPSSVLYCRHTENMTISKFNVKINSEKLKHSSKKENLIKTPMIFEYCKNIDLISIKIYGQDKCGQTPSIMALYNVATFKLNGLITDIKYNKILNIYSKNCSNIIFEHRDHKKY
ncbi:MAG: glycoside hydrolase family 28 protein [Promethearchaeota archaeon]